MDGSPVASPPDGGTLGQGRREMGSSVGTCVGGAAAARSDSREVTSCAMVLHPDRCLPLAASRSRLAKPQAASPSPVYSASPTARLQCLAPKGHARWKSLRPVARLGRQRADCLDV